MKEYYNLLHTHRHKRTLPDCKVRVFHYVVSVFLLILCPLLILKVKVDSRNPGKQ